jgi:hypothetical protein
VGGHGFLNGGDLVCFSVNPVYEFSNRLCWAPPRLRGVQLPKESTEPGRAFAACNRRVIDLTDAKENRSEDRRDNTKHLNSSESFLLREGLQIL